MNLPVKYIANPIKYQGKKAIIRQSRDGNISALIWFLNDILSTSNQEAFEICKPYNKLKRDCPVLGENLCCKAKMHLQSIHHQKFAELLFSGWDELGILWCFGPDFVGSIWYQVPTVLCASFISSELLVIFIAYCGMYID